MAAHTDICDTHFCDLCAANLNDRCLIKVDYMNRLGRRVGNRLNNHVVLAVFEQLEVKQTEHAAILALNSVFESMLAKFAFEVFPNVAVHDWCLFTVALSVQPLLDAAEANPLHGAGALTWLNKLVLGQVFLRETDAADELVAVKLV
jgi:hypothetical protein